MRKQLATSLAASFRVSRARPKVTVLVVANRVGLMKPVHKLGALIVSMRDGIPARDAERNGLHLATTAQLQLDRCGLRDEGMNLLAPALSKNRSVQQVCARALCDKRAGREGVRRDGAGQEKRGEQDVARARCRWRAGW